MGLLPIGSMLFVYGYVEETGGGKRWGWISLDALKPKAAQTSLPPLLSI